MSHRHIALAAIIGITVIETTALLCHIDGRFLMPAIAAIAGLGGFTLGLRHQKTN